MINNVNGVYASLEFFHLFMLTGMRKNRDAPRTNIFVAIYFLCKFDIKFLNFDYHELIHMSGWPSGLRRQTQGEKPCFLIGSENEISGPLMRAGVRIPFLTTTIFGRTFPVCRRWIFCPCKSLSLGI